MVTSDFRDDDDGDDSRRWYGLFSRGARDWLRHNEKVREAVRENLPDLVAGSDILSSDGERKVRVQVRFLEHYRFRLRDADSETGVGQGDVEPGDVLRPASPGEAGEKGGGGDGDGGLQFAIELKIDDIVDWLWQQLELPNLRAKAGAVEQSDYTREGWDRRGARSRLDRRRSIKESIKRRAVQPAGPLFTNEDLRYRQLVRRDRPATQAVVFFGLDVSSSMTDPDRKLAKTFFFWVVQGLRRQYRHIELVFVAHTTQAWEFAEDEFFQVKGSGGTVASTAFNKINEIISDRYDPGRYNIYAFYASDGENFAEDQVPALEALEQLVAATNYTGYLEINPPHRQSLMTPTAQLFRHLAGRDAATGLFALNDQSDVWDGIRKFFSHEADAAA